MDTVNTISSIAVFSVLTPLWYFVYYKHHHSLLYTHINQHGWLYFIFTIPLIFLLHDAYFYWAHRIMHHRLIFRYVHKSHHRSQHPTAASGFAFSPIEAAIQAVFVLTIPAILPIQYGLFVVFTWLLIIRIIYGHNGHEGSTLKREKIGLYRILSTPTHHEMHHTRPNSNYGLWFVFWDQLMGTENKSYYKELKQNILRKQDKVTAPSSNSNPTD